MRILHVESGRHLYGGGKQVLYLMEGLAERGVDNLLACPSGSHIAAQARAFGQVIEMPMKGDLDIGLAGRLKRAIRAHRADLLHVHSRRGADVWGGIAAHLAKTPAVISRRVDNPESTLAVKLKYGLYDHVITISDGIRQVLLSEGMPAARVSCVRSALDPSPYLHDYDKAGFRRALGLPEDTLVAGIVAQLIERKGHRHLLAALPDVLQRHPGLQVLVFGRGPLERALHDAVDAQGLSSHVRFMGFVDDLPAQLGCLDLLVHPADMEGLGVSLLQASAAQVPIIACRAGGMPEAVRDGVNGLLIDVGDVPALTDTMNRLLDDAPMRERLGHAGRQLVLDEFSVDVMCEGNLAIYTQVLGQ